MTSREPTGEHRPRVPKDPESEEYAEFMRRKYRELALGFLLFPPGSLEEAAKERKEAERNAESDG